MYSSVCYTYLRNNCWTVCPVTDMNLDYTRQISAANNCVRCLLSDLLHFDLITILCDIGRCRLQYWLTQQKLQTDFVNCEQDIDPSPGASIPPEAMMHFPPL